MKQFILEAKFDFHLLGLILSSATRDEERGFPLAINMVTPICHLALPSWITIPLG